MIVVLSIIVIRMVIKKRNKTHEFIVEIETEDLPAGPRILGTALKATVYCVSRSAG